jgi:hypothetical protein
MALTRVEGHLIASSNVGGFLCTMYIEDMSQVRRVEHSYSRKPLRALLCLGYFNVVLMKQRCRVN